MHGKPFRNRGFVLACILLLCLALASPSTASAQVDDTTHPLSGLSIETPTVDTSAGPATVVLRASVTDDVSGVQGVAANAKGPSGGGGPDSVAYELVSGSPHDGVHEIRLALPQYSEQGTWHVTSPSLWDEANNWITLYESDLTALGYPSTNPSELKVLSYNIYMLPSLDAIIESAQDELLAVPNGLIDAVNVAIGLINDANDIVPGVPDIPLVPHLTVQDLLGPSRPESPIQSERIDRIMSWLDDEGAPWDVIVWSEAFWQTLSPELLVDFKEKLDLRGYDYHTTVIASPQPLSLNGGVFISSKWPIVEEDQHVYENACGEDLLSDKGVKYAKINKLGTTYHVAGSHLQANPSVLPCVSSIPGLAAWLTFELIDSIVGPVNSVIDFINDALACTSPFSPFSCIRRVGSVGNPVERRSRDVRLAQFREFSKFIDDKNIPANELVVLAGDFNADLFASADPSSEFFEEYANMLIALKATDANTNALTQQAANNGPYSYDKDTNDLAEDTRELLDYVLYRYSGPRQIETSSSVLEAKTSGGLDPSDHYPVSALLALNRPPIADAGGAYTVDEGGSVLLSGAGSTDPDGDPLIYEWDLDNDGTFEMVGIGPSFSAADLDGPSTRTVRLRVTDTGELSDTDEAEITVDNVDPVITSVASSATFDDDVEEGETVTVSGSFTDVGTLDTHTVSVDWGDLTTSPAVVTQGAGGGTFTADHAYVAGGVYVVTVTLTDDDTGTTSDTALAVVIGIGINDGVLQVVGTASDDHVDVKVVKDEIDVFASFVNAKHRRYDLTEVTKIEVWLAEGNDHCNVHQSIHLPATIHGGDGADMLWGGTGDDFIEGADGNDKLWGRGGGDELHGDAGNDKLWGGKGLDVLVGGAGNDHIMQ